MVLEVDTYTIPTEAPESDGTLKWESTSLLVVHAHAADEVGLGYSYTGSGAGSLVRDTLAPALEGELDVPEAWRELVSAVRNLGLSGLAAAAISAVDCALWDLKARRLGLPLPQLMGRARSRVPVYGSGGFTSYTPERLVEQLTGWVSEGIPRVKMKVGRDPAEDTRRVGAVRRALGPEPELFVDANAAYTPKQAVRFAEQFAAYGVSWFEEPCSSAGLPEVRRRAPGGMEVAAGEYGWRLQHFRALLERRSVDVLQADVTRCLGYTGFLAVADLCAAYEIDLSAHCAPALSLPACCAAKRLRHQELFFDHARIENLLFDGVPPVRDGSLEPPSVPGHGLTLKRKDAEPYHD